MLSWIADNWGTLLLCALLAAVVGAIVRKLVRDRKKGKTPCGCGCQNCAMSGSCHKKAD